MKTNKIESPLKRREFLNDIETKNWGPTWDELRSYLITDLGGVRRRGGVSIIQALIWNLGSSRSGVKGEIQAVDTVENESTNTEHWGRMTRSSVEVCESRWSKGVMLFSFMNRSTERSGGACE